MQTLVLMVHILCAAGIVCFLESRLGLPPWDVLHQGIAKHTPLSFGLANEVVAVAVLVVAWALGFRSGGVDIAGTIFTIVIGTIAFAAIGFLLAGRLRAETNLAAANALFLVFLLTSGIV
ncbi:MAG: hypothetical protein ABR585_15820, partial [Gemmatimonadaceae bacterium]